MCGRYEILDGKLIFTRFQVRNTTRPLLQNLDVRPTQQIPVLLTDHELELMQWGLVPSCARDVSVGSKMINARAETVAEKPAFKRALRSQRCIIPASAFFEWKGNPGHKIKYRIARSDGDMIGLAGLYDLWRSPFGNELKTCTIITTTPNQVVESIHNRMPVILLPEDEDDWLNPDMTEPQDIVQYLRRYPDGLLEAVAVA